MVLTAARTCYKTRMNRIDLDGRVAVITGGSGGIGFATAQRMAASGATVVLWDRDARELSSAPAQRFPGGPSTALDVTDEAAVARATDATMARCGRIDILVNAAGITAPKAHDPRDLACGVAAHLRHQPDGHVPRRAARSAGTWSRPTTGASSTSARSPGKEGNPFSAAYSASKAAVISFTKSMAKELAKTGVRVNCVAPAIIATKNLYHDMPEEMRSCGCRACRWDGRARRRKSPR